MRTDQVHRGDDAEPEDGDSETTRSSPRHAAPRKPLFTRFQMPAGKAIAIAAMPTAVLMGMGLTPTLAQAKSMPKNPFSDGPCVTKSDEAQDKADQKKAEEAKEKAAAAKKAAAEKKAEAEKKAAEARKKQDGDKASPSPSPSSSGSSGSGSSGSGSSGSSTSGSGSLLGSLGDTVDGTVKGVGGLLNGGKSSSSPSPSTSPSPSASARKSGSAGDTVGKVTGSLGDTVGKVTDSVGDTVGKVGDAAKGVTKPSPSASSTDGKQPFPCVVEKKSAGKDETPPIQLANQPWRLEASSLLGKGMHYAGVVNLQTENGSTKQALKYVSTGGIDIGDLHQIAEGPDGKETHVVAAKGSTSTFRDGTVTLYIESLSGNLFGVLPITFDPEHPPPVDIPVTYFTNARLTFAGLVGSTLTVPGLHSYITG